MYRAVTGWLKLLMVLAVLDHTVGRMNRVVPSSAVAETKPDVVSEYCTSISKTCWYLSAIQGISILRPCVTTPWTMKMLPKSICIHKGSVAVFGTHASMESSMDRALLVPGAASSYVDEYDRDASGGFVMIICATGAGVDVGTGGFVGEICAVDVGVVSSTVVMTSGSKR